MINRDSRGHPYSIVRGEILGFIEDELLRKHLPRMFSLISERKLGDRRRSSESYAAHACIWSSVTCRKTTTSVLDGQGQHHQIAGTPINNETEPDATPPGGENACAWARKTASGDGNNASVGETCSQFLSET